MPEHSLYEQKTDLVKITITIGSKAVSDKVTIAGVSIYKSANKISTDKIEIYDGNISDAEFETIENEQYIPGTKVEIGLGYHKNDEICFKGIIVKHTVRITSLKGPKIYLECADEAIKLTGQRKFKYHDDTKDSDLIQKLAKGFQTDIDATQKKHEMLVQHNTSDWDMIVTRAQANNMLVFNDQGKISAKKIKVGSSTAVLTYGENIIDTDLTIDARSQIKDLHAFAWDPKTQDMVSSVAEEPSDLEKAGKELKGKDIAGKLKYEKSEIRSTGIMDTEELQSWADGSLLISRLSRLRGIIKTQGIKVNPMDTVEIKSLGTYYDGDAYVTGVYHEQKEGNWTTEIEIGLHSDLFVQQKADITLPIADGLIPGVHGLFIGKVKKIDQDPEGQFRVQIRMPMVLGKTGEGVWARVSNIMASNGFGSWFMPEVDDEVICGALGGDPRFPIILGHLYSDNKLKHHEEFKYNKDNNFKGWVTREKLVLHFDDKDQIIRIETPGGQKFKLDDKDKSITLEDEHGNKMLMNNKGFKFSGKKDFIVDVKGKINAKSIQGSTIEATGGDFNGKGMNSTIKGNITATLDGATASVKGKMMASVKAGMVMIN